MFMYLFLFSWTHPHCICSMFHSSSSVVFISVWWFWKKNYFSLKLCRSLYAVSVCWVCVWHFNDFLIWAQNKHRDKRQNFVFYFDFIELVYLVQRLNLMMKIHTHTWSVDITTRNGTFFLSMWLFFSELWCDRSDRKKKNEAGVIRWVFLISIDYAIQ